MRVHELKTEARFFDRLFDGFATNDKGGKCAEIRRNDREFKVGDYLILKRTKGGVSEYQYPALVIAQITDILDYRDFPEGLKPGYVMLSLRQVPWHEQSIVFELQKHQPPF